ncbi:uncharacterized protein N7500_009056 [Penicillium coprophilum]|uniref:uncharacterized protein n=1 Tax=Penicillium coprophilum TaxID=36646 RepID=UPI00238AC361|nr:uncharacterized protein N7500_009056 [Penicillium coprophilum]KAJ5153617.1 hypothetical protein N7500_009056 [Penicillium coprophilum]
MSYRRVISDEVAFAAYQQDSRAAVPGPFGILGALKWYGKFEHPSLQEPVSWAINWVISILGSHETPDFWPYSHFPCWRPPGGNSGIEERDT